MLHTALAPERHVNSPSPFAWSKPLHADNYGSIYQVLLGLFIRIFQELDERQDGVDSPQRFDKLALVVVVDSSPCQSIPVVSGGSLLRCISNIIVKTRRLRVNTHFPTEDSNLMLLRGYQNVDDLTGNFWREKSALFATSFGIQSSIPPEPPAIAILTIVLGW